MIKKEQRQYQEAEEAQIAAARKVLNGIDQKHAKLIKFAAEEKDSESMCKDLKALYTAREAVALSKVFYSDPKKFATMIQSGFTCNLVKSDIEQHDPARPYVGQIVYSAGGYDCRIIWFYQVVKVTKCYVWLQSMKKQSVENVDGYWQQTMVRPGRLTDEKPHRHKIHSYPKDHTWRALVSSYEVVHPWDGKDKYEDTLD